MLARHAGTTACWIPAPPRQINSTAGARRQTCPQWGQWRHDLLRPRLRHLGLHAAEHGPPDRMAGLGGREVEVAVGLERLAELVAARALPARRAGDEREVLVRGGLVVEGRQAERQRGLRVAAPRSCSRRPRSFSRRARSPARRGFSRAPRRPVRAARRGATREVARPGAGRRFPSAAGSQAPRVPSRWASRTPRTPALTQRRSIRDAWRSGPIVIRTCA